MLLPWNAKECNDDTQELNAMQQEYMVVKSNNGVSELAFRPKYS